MPTEIRQLEALDMTSDERVTYHATEWVSQEGKPCVDVWSQASAADRQANTIVQGGALAVARYAVIAHFNTDLGDAQDFARDNLRLHGVTD
ncbi:hypothetical protein [Paraburkholderia sediminicola]|uniref:hypothetical protein n=1 Tax=Paraburkholderia sediminicola TaxID=458836 RepID=UPI000E733437